MTSHAAFDYQPRTRLVYGVGTVDRVGELAAELGGKRILLVTDVGIAKAGHAQRVLENLSKHAEAVTLFDKVHENPTTKDVNDCLAVAREAKIDLIVGLGGGSSMDTAKGTNFLLTNGGEMKDYWGVGKAMKPMLPLIAIPTTAGTGSECQCAALIADEETHNKMACLDPKAAAKVAILDPALTVSMPQRVTAFTGIDAIAHAVETAVSKKRNPLSLMYSYAAFRLLVPSLPRVLSHPDDVEARGRMLLGAAYAGTAIENSMLGAAHSAANPLTAHFNIVHGQAVGMMLPQVVRFNSEDPEALQGYAELASSAEIAKLKDGATSALEGLIARLDSLLNIAKMPRTLGECGVSADDLPVMADEAVKQWTVNFNPRPLTAANFRDLYERAFDRRSDGDLV